MNKANACECCIPELCFCEYSFDVDSIAGTADDIAVVSPANKTNTSIAKMLMDDICLSVDIDCCSSRCLTSGLLTPLPGL